jgi:hypothetical protein
MAAKPISHAALLAELQRHFTRQATDRNYKLPLFKFLKTEHAEDLIKNLALRIGNISFYRDPRHGGLISDEFEGIALFKEEQRINGLLTTHTQDTKIQIDNVYIYCTTQSLLSDSLNWALSENKDTCVLITDPVDFASSICDSTSNLTFGSGGPCRYEGRSFSLSDARGIELFEDIINITLLKDKIYARQHEFRFAWHINSGDTNPPDYLDIKLERRPKLIPVLYKKMDNFFDPLNWIGMVGVTVFDANDSEIGGFELEVPKKVFFPITYDDGDESYLSFYPEGGTDILSGGYIRCTIEFSDIGPLIGKFPLNLIGRIEYKFFPGARCIPGQKRVS